MIFFSLWDRHKTDYIIEGNFLKSKNAVTDHSLNINSIFQIQKTTAFLKSGIFTSNKGLLIKYNKYDELFISPKDQDRILQALKEVNPSIEIQE